MNAKIGSALVDPINVLKSGKTVCSGYSRLFRDMIKEAHIEVFNITGYAKGLGYKLGQ